MENKQNIPLSRAMVAVLYLRLQERIKEKKYKNIRDFAHRCLGGATGYTAFFRLVRGEPSTGRTAKLDMDLASDMAFCLDIGLIEVIVSAELMLRNGTFPADLVAGEAPLYKRPLSIEEGEGDASD